MRIRRQPERPRRGRRFAVAGFAAAVVLIPGVARADGVGDGATAPAVPPGVGAAVTSLLPGGTDPVPGGDPTGLLPGSGDQQQSGSPAAGSNGTNTAPAGTPAPPSLPPQLQQLLDQLQSGQPSPECSAAIQADLTKLLTDIPSLVQAIIADLTQQLGGGSPPSPQQILDQLTGLFGSSQSQQAAAADPSSPNPDPTVIFADLQQLVTDLTTKCAPKPPPTTTPPPPPPAEGGGQQPQPQPQPQPVAQPVAQPVSYPGYAPTGSIAPAAAEHPVDTAPLAALGGGVLLVSAAATAAVRIRGRRAGR